jgi:hypothetical protein
MGRDVYDLSPYYIHMSRCNDSLVIAIRQEEKEIFRTTAMLFYII